MIEKITRAYVRHYRDNGQTVAYVEWLDQRGNTGRTEGPTGPCKCCGAARIPVKVKGRDVQMGEHMAALFDRARREGITIERETW